MVKKVSDFSDLFMPLFFISVTDNSILPGIPSKHLGGVHVVFLIHQHFLFHHQNTIIVQLFHLNPALLATFIPQNLYVEILTSKGDGLVSGAIGM